jgi:hypothetical protein
MYHPVKSALDDDWGLVAMQKYANLNRREVVNNSSHNVRMKSKQNLQTSILIFYIRVTFLRVLVEDSGLNYAFL